MPEFNQVWIPAFAGMTPGLRSYAIVEQFILMDQSKLKLKAVTKEVYASLDGYAHEFRKIFGL